MNYSDENTKEELLNVINELSKENKRLTALVAKLLPKNSARSRRKLKETVEATENTIDSLGLNLAANDILCLNPMVNTVLNSVPVYVFLKDVNDEFRYVYCNDTFTSHMGLAITDVLGKTDTDLFPKFIDAERIRRDDINVVKKGRLECMEEFTTQSGEERMAKTVKVLTVTENKAQYILGISWDVTEVKNIEMELISTRIKAEESERLKTAFLANLNHEIRTPLNAIVGFSSLICNSELKAEQLQYGRLIEKNSEILLQLINNILDLASLESGMMKLTSSRFCIYTVFNELFAKYKDKVERGVKLIIDPIDELLELENDVVRFKQVMDNLLSNAIKFTPSGEIHMGVMLKRDMVQIYVKDSGRGINTRHAAKVFKRFGQTDEFVQGVGLGLVISRMLVEKMGGMIWLQSKVQRGSVFYFTLPALSKAEE